MVRLIFVKFVFVFFSSLFFLSLVPARASDEVKGKICASPTGIGVEGRSLLERTSVEPIPEVIPLFYFPRDGCGYVDWAEALRQGILAPRDSIKEKYSLTKPEKSPGDITIQVKDPRAEDVIFPHDTHSEVLDCKSCHPGIFRKEAGSTKISMAAIFKGEYCGRCHGKVSFPLLNCSRCHSSSSEMFTNK